LAVAVGEEESTIEDVYEPYLIQEGYLIRTPNGRLATDKAHIRFGFVPTVRQIHNNHPAEGQPFQPELF
ncbi:MAG: hypothetical protein IKZ84_15720, partial [Victivallales bacterium]|nr:hypothetical protein [Victivallales bacterium]